MAMLGYGLESFVDVFSSVMVVWRFSQALDPALSVDEDKYAERLEKRAGIGICITFILIAFIVGGQASAHLHEGHYTKADTVMIVLASVSVVAFAVLGGGKWYISKKLNSPTMMKDAICSIAIGVISLAVAISAGVNSGADDAVWYFDSVVAVLVSIFLFVYGMRTLCFHGHRWWETSFWKDDAESIDAHDRNMRATVAEGSVMDGDTRE